MLWPWPWPCRHHPQGRPGPEGRTAAADSVRIPLTLSGLQCLCYKGNMRSLLASITGYHSLPALPASHLHGKLRTGEGRPPRQGHHPGGARIAQSPPQLQVALQRHHVSSWKLPGKGQQSGLFCCKLQKKVSCGRGLGRGKKRYLPAASLKQILVSLQKMLGGRMRSQS